MPTSFAGLLLLLGLLPQQAPSPVPSGPTATPTAAAQGTYLGLLFAPNTSAPLHLGPDHLHGVVITQVLPKSPAETVGVQRNDLLQGYDQERITSCEQLARLIQNDTPGRKVKLDLLRGGRRVTLQAELALGPALRLQGESRPPTPDTNPGEANPAVSKPARPALSAQIEPFGDGRLRVDLQYYREGTGRLHTRTLTGTLADLQRDIASFDPDERRLAQVLLDRLKQLELSPARPRP